MVIKTKDGRGKYLKETKAIEVADRLERVELSLKHLSEDKLKFENVTHLSEYLATYIRDKYPGENVSASTLRRKDAVYRALLEEHLDKKKKPKSQLALAQQNLMVQQLENVNLRKEIKAHEVTISRLLSETSSLKESERIERTHGLEAPESESAYLSVMKILKHFGIESIDIREDGIYDKANIFGPKPIIIRNDFPEFFTWYFSKVTSG